MKPAFFTSRESFRRWLETHHARKRELWIGFHRKSSGREGMSYKEALDEALCYGWIDGVRRRVDGTSYAQRFTPRKPKSYWSAVNVKRARELIKEKRMAVAGLQTFGRRDAAGTARYSFERAAARFEPAQLKQFQANRRAWTFFESQPPYYKRVATFWVVSAKKEDTRARRLAALIADCAARRRLGLVTGSKA